MPSPPSSACQSGSLSAFLSRSAAPRSFPPPLCLSLSSESRSVGKDTIPLLLPPSEGLSRSEAGREREESIWQFPDKAGKAQNGRTEEKEDLGGRKKGPYQQEAGRRAKPTPPQGRPTTPCPPDRPPALPLSLPLRRRQRWPSSQLLNFCPFQGQQSRSRRKGHRSEHGIRGRLGWPGFELCRLPPPTQKQRRKLLRN